MKNGLFVKGAAGYGLLGITLFFVLLLSAGIAQASIEAEGEGEFCLDLEPIMVHPLSADQVDPPSASTASGTVSVYLCNEEYPCPYKKAQKSEYSCALYTVLIEHTVANPTGGGFRGLVNLDFTSLESPITLSILAEGMDDCPDEWVCKLLSTGTFVEIESDQGVEIRGVVGNGDTDCDCAPVDRRHSGDYTAPSYMISLSELLRFIQLYNSDGYHCAQEADLSDEGYMPGAGDHSACTPHTGDFSGVPDWSLDLTELLRFIQFYNSDGYYACEGHESDEGFCPTQ